MAEILAVVSGGPRDRAVRATAAGLAELLDHETVELVVARPGTGPDRAERVLTALTSDPPVLAVLAAERSPDALCWQVIGRAGNPTVLVPPDASRPVRPIRRVLVPLDGTCESALAVAETTRLLDRAGIDLIVLHVFDASTAPAFWDQPAHAYEAWADEFRSRAAAPRSARLELRSGSPSGHVVTVAAEQDVDLVALAWRQRLEPERAKTVRASVLEAPVPVLLVPIGTGPALLRPDLVSSGTSEGGTHARERG